MIIRRGQETDIENIYHIEKLAFPDSPWTREMLSHVLLRKKDRKAWVIEWDKKIIGYCMVRFGPGEVHLINMAVHSKYQRQGVGSKMLNHFLAQFPPKTSVFLEVDRGNFPAINLYKKSGFTEIGVRKNYYQTGGDAIVMCLKV